MFTLAPAGKRRVLYAQANASFGTDQLLDVWPSGARRRFPHDGLAHSRNGRFADLHQLLVHFSAERSPAERPIQRRCFFASRRWASDRTGRRHHRPWPIEKAAALPFSSHEYVHVRLSVGLSTSLRWAARTGVWVSSLRWLEQCFIYWRRDKPLWASARRQ